MRPRLRSRLREAVVKGSRALGSSRVARESPVEKPGRVRTRVAAGGRLLRAETRGVAFCAAGSPRRARPRSCERPGARGFLLPELGPRCSLRGAGFVRNRVLPVDERLSQCLERGSRPQIPALPGSAYQQCSPCTLLNTSRACHPGGAVRSLYGVVKIP